MEELWGLPGGESVATNQVLYNLSRRGIEYDLLPWCRSADPDHGLFADRAGPAARAIARCRRSRRATGRRRRRSRSPGLLRQDDVIAIPKAATIAHVRENRAASTSRLTQDDLAALDRAFPPPKATRPLEML